jgi:hypothetical protein
MTCVSADPIERRSKGSRSGSAKAAGPARGEHLGRVPRASRNEYPMAGTAACEHQLET